jgi:septum formation protein
VLGRSWSIILITVNSQLIMSSHFIYLASQSPRRRELLNQIGVQHQLLLPGDDEDAEALETERTGELPADYVQRVTLAKLQAACLRLQRRNLPFSPILCADTTVALGRRILGKPCDVQDAITTLTLLSGKTHRVITAIAVFNGVGNTLAVSTSRVRFAHIPAAEIAAYVRSGEPFGKAGAYAIQGYAASWINRIEGSHSGITGLPLFETAQLLRQAVTEV